MRGFCVIKLARKFTLYTYNYYFQRNHTTLQAPELLDKRRVCKKQYFQAKEKTNSIFYKNIFARLVCSIMIQMPSVFFVEGHRAGACIYSKRANTILLPTVVCSIKIVHTGKCLFSALVCNPFDVFSFPLMLTGERKYYIIQRTWHKRWFDGLCRSTI